MSEQNVMHKLGQALLNANIDFGGYGGLFSDEIIITVPKIRNPSGMLLDLYDTSKWDFCISGSNPFADDNEIRTCIPCDFDEKGEKSQHMKKYGFGPMSDNIDVDVVIKMLIEFYKGEQRENA
jgi:hypothetical protein